MAGAKGHDLKIQLASDLHLEVLHHQWPGERVIAPASDADVLVLAGDIASGVEPFKLFSNWPSQPRRVPIVAVAGNHELFSHVYSPFLEKMHEVAALNNIHFLENESVAIGDTRFLGCILWTDYKLDENRPQSLQMQYAQRTLDDHRLIRTGRKVFTAQDALDRHMESRAWLIEELAKPWSGRTVVLTHHAPHPLSVHTKYAGDIMSAAYVSDLSEILLSEHAPDLWVHGHVHDSFDYRVGRTRVVANPAGYVMNRRAARGREDFSIENKAFVLDLVLEV